MRHVPVPERGGTTLAQRSYAPFRGSRRRPPDGLRRGLLSFAPAELFSGPSAELFSSPRLRRDIHFGVARYMNLARKMNCVRLRFDLESLLG
jgi:hypothetical protein